MPTFLFLRNLAKVGVVRGANREALVAMLEQHGTGSADAAASGGAAAAAAPAEPATQLLPGLLVGHVSQAVSSGQVSAVVLACVLEHSLISFTFFFFFFFV